MAEKIASDYARFRKIVKGKVRKELEKYIQQGELLARKKDKKVSIPLPNIDIPRFRFGQQQKGTGQGEGEVGESLGKKQPGQQGKAGEAGSEAGEHELEVDLSLEELAEILGEKLELPRIQPKGKKNMAVLERRFSGIRRIGPESLRHFKRTFREGLKRAIMSGVYDPHNPVIVPEREDRRYRSWKETIIPENSAVLIYMMDVSGSMGEEQKELVRMTSFWLDTWLRSQYKQIESVYIVHDAQAKEVDEHTFYRLREAGGTKISSAYELCATTIEARFNPQEWNIYLFHFSDGDNWGSEDNKRCIELLKNKLLPCSNLFCYGQVRSAYGSGKFKHELEQALPNEEKLITQEISRKEEIVPSIKNFLGTGK